MRDEDALRKTCRARRVHDHGDVISVLLRHCPRDIRPRLLDLIPVHARHTQLVQRGLVCLTRVDDKADGGCLPKARGEGVELVGMGDDRHHLRLVERMHNRVHPERRVHRHNRVAVHEAGLSRHLPILRRLRVDGDTRPSGDTAVENTVGEGGDARVDLSIGVPVVLSEVKLLQVAAGVFVLDGLALEETTSAEAGPVRVLLDGVGEGGRESHNALMGRVQQLLRALDTAVYCIAAGKGDCNAEVGRGSCPSGGAATARRA
mmetsp:Transcript_27425/g.65034  ORF Transcript_27425/g.65034 Transcript_27425/m.65034 type:complete len:261 (+) Transcript_27425:997-1779(+)